MIEIIRDPNDREVLLYTDSRAIAVKIRKAISLFGAVYSGPQTGFSWRIPNRTATLLIKSLGLSIDDNSSVDK